MSTENAGAIIRIIFYILRLDRKINEYFESGYIVNRYNKLLKESLNATIIKEIIKKFGKIGAKKKIKTLENKILLQQWLNKHTNIKEIFWFIKSGNKFKLKAKYVIILNKML